MRNFLRWIPAQLGRLRSQVRKPGKIVWARLSPERLEDRITPSTDVWTGLGGNDDWSTAGNWSNTNGSRVPVAGDALVFPAGPANELAFNDLAASTLFSSITFQTGGYVLSGAGIKLSTGIQATSFVGTDAIVLNIALTASQTFNVAGAGAVLDLDNVLSGAAGITESGFGGLLYEGSLPNTYTGATTVNGGTLVLEKGSANVGATAIPGPLVINAGGSVQYLGFGNQIAATASVTVNFFSTLSLNNQSNQIASLTLTGGTVATGTGTLTLGGNITANAGDSPATISGNLKLGGAVRTVTVAPSTAAPELTIAANISEGGLTKMGLGTLVLSGANNTYAGGTTVSAGTVEVQTSNALGTGSVGVTAGATLRINVDGVLFANALTLNGAGVGGNGALQCVNAPSSDTWKGNIVLATTSSVDVDAISELDLFGTISGTGGLTEIGGGTLVMDGANANTFTGTTTVNAGSLDLAQGAGGIRAVGNLVIGAATGSAQVNIFGSNELTATATVTVNSTGTVDLKGGNDTIGALTLTGGALVENTVLTLNGGVLTVNGNIVSNASAVPATISANLGLGGAVRSVTVASATTLDITGNISGTGLTKLGAGTLVLGGANTYAGTTTVSAGILEIQTNSALGAAGGTAPSGTTVNAGASLVIDGSLVVGNEMLTLNGTGVAGAGALQDDNGTSSWAGPVTLSTATSVDVGPNTTLTLNGPIGGAGSWTLTTASGGQLILGGPNTYTGATTVSQGSFVVLTNVTALGASGPTSGTTVAAGAQIFVSVAGSIAEPLTLNAGAVLTGDGGTWSGNIVLAGTASVIAINDPITLSGVISGAGGLDVTADGSLVILSGMSGNTFTGTTTVEDGNLHLDKTTGVALKGPLIVNQDSEADLLASNQILNTAAVTVSGTLGLQNSADQTIGVLTVTGGSVTSSVSADLTVNGVLTLTGGAIDGNGEGTLTLNNNIVSNAAATSSTIAGILNLAATTRTVTVAAGTVPDSGADLLISALVSSTGTAGLTKLGLGKLALSGDNSIAGTTTVSAGTLAVRNDSALGESATGTVVASGASLVIDVNDIIVPSNVNVTLNGAGVDGAGALQEQGATDLDTWEGKVTLASAASLGVAATGTLVVTGLISGPFALSKVGAGELALFNANAYTGGTNITAGSLAAFNSAGSATGPGTVFIMNGGALAGTGAVGNVLVENGGILAPSDDAGPGTLSAGSVFFAAGGIFSVIVNNSGVASELNVTGTVSINNATLNLAGTDAGTYTVININGINDVVGTFTVFTGSPCTVAYDGGPNNNDVTLTIG